MSFRLEMYDSGPWEMFTNSFLSGYLIELKLRKSYAFDPELRRRLGIEFEHGFHGDVMVYGYASKPGALGMKVRHWDDETSQSVGEPFFVPWDAIKSIGIY